MRSTRKYLFQIIAKTKKTGNKVTKIHKNFTHLYTDFSRHDIYKYLNQLLILKINKKHYYYYFFLVATNIL